MNKRYAVKCKTCEANIALPDLESINDIETTIVYVPPLDPIECKECGSSYLYVSDDVLVL